MDLKAMAAKLGLPEDADEDTILAKLDEVNAEREELKAKAEAKPEDDERLKTLAASAAKGEEAAKKLHEMSRDTLLAKAVEDGKILPVQKDAYAAMYDADPEKVTALLDATPAKSFTAKGGDGSTKTIVGGAQTSEDVPVNATEYRDENGATIATVADGDWLHIRACEILKEAGKSDKDYAAYADAVAQAQDEALTKVA